MDAAKAERPALSVGSVVGGQHDRDAVETALRLAARATNAVSPAAGERDASINVIFQVSGHLFQTEHEGLRTGRFTRSKGLLVIEVGVPDDLRDEDAARMYYADSLVMAVDIAETHLARKAPNLSVELARTAAVAARELMLAPGFLGTPPSGPPH